MIPPRFLARDQRDEAIAQLKARATRAGFELHVIIGLEGMAEFVVCRWGLSRTLPDALSVATFLDKAKAPR